MSKFPIPNWIKENTEKLNKTKKFTDIVRKLETLASKPKEKKAVLQNKVKNALSQIKQVITAKQVIPSLADPEFVQKLSDKFESILRTLSSPFVTNNITKMVDEVMSKAPEIGDLIVKNPYLLLQNPDFHKLINNKKLWSSILKHKEKIAAKVVKKLALNEKSKSNVEELMGNVSQLFLKKDLVKDILQNTAILANPDSTDPEKMSSLIKILQKGNIEKSMENANQLFLKKDSVKDILQNATILANPDSTDPEKMSSLTEILKNSNELVNLATDPNLWKVIKDNKEIIAKLAVSNLNLPNEQREQTKALFEDLLEITSTTSQDKNRIPLQNMIKDLSIITDPNEQKELKRKQSFKLINQLIQYAESNKNVLKSLQKHQEILVEILSPHMPPGINAETIVSDIVLNKNTLNTLKKAYSQFRDSKYVTVGAIRALATVAKSSVIRHLALNFIIPNFMRRSRVNKTLDSILANSNSQHNDLAQLCKTTSTGFIVHHSLNGRYLKGLTIKHSLYDFTINNFNLNGATFGHADEDFSLANSKIKNTSFKNVKFNCKQIDISGMQIDGKSFETLLSSIKKFENIKIDNPIKITGMSEDVLRELINAPLYRKNPRKFEFTLAQAKEPLVQKKAQQKKSLSAIQKLNFIPKLFNTDNEVIRNARKIVVQKSPKVRVTLRRDTHIRR